MSMIKRLKYIGKICILMACIFILCGCAADSGTPQEDVIKAGKAEQDVTVDNDTTGQDTETADEKPVLSQNSVSLSQDVSQEPELVETDWSEYFAGLNGTAVLYDASASRYMIYDPELAAIRRSPCSTFKIISSAIALENGIIQPEDSMHTWSGEVFWNEDWNQDIAFPEAFRTSCVWYFREVINEMGPEMIQDGLDRLEYGNCDISDWEGQLNTNNNNRALTGFWIESSLKISPIEQTEVMERIFGGDSICSEKTRNELKEVMFVEEPEQTVVPIYGKTGMGKAAGVVVDAWFTGFAEGTEGNIYFCVYLGQTDDPNVSSATAREIAIRIVEEYCK